MGQAIDTELLLDDEGIDKVDETAILDGIVLGVVVEAKLDDPEVAAVLPTQTNPGK